MSVFAGEYVEAPPVAPRPYGLFSAAVVLDDLTGHSQLGVQYEPDYCGPAGDTLGACDTALGTVAISVDDAAEATIDATGVPVASGDYTIDWGDDDTDTVAALDGAQHTYADPGSYSVFITGPQAFSATVEVTVTDGVATGPFDGTVAIYKAAQDGYDLVRPVPFALWQLHTCRAPGGGYDRAQERARRSLQLGEARAAERVFARHLQAHDDAVDITPTPGTALPLVDALALLEKWAGDNYPGVPVVHADRAVVTLWDSGDVVHQVGQTLQTLQGTLIAAGSGYSGLLGPGGDAPAAGEAWVYVTGQVVVRRAPQADVSDPIVQMTPATNQVTVLAERAYSIGTECIVGAVLVTADSGAIISGGDA